MPTPNPFEDAVRPILDAAEGLTNAERERAWDAYYESPSVSILARRFSDAGIEPELAQKLCVAKHESLPLPSHAEKVTAVIHQLAQIDPKVLAVCEAHPNVLRLLTSAKD